ncbi:MAG: ComEC/Rec2 family competence protein [Cyanomargarita calcarea GSE-NOS-MK-12-04C]|jgi:competence protein ComEC|uniref:ComEC/Rec2 family competence protein n=1 Tax=Cyanomargarita calcarea GSE-NOS-MK-12-04C TaxID=2839659 RepID=A0A951QVL7_9CYAN|nr:ComEC/Rec2 family competence protein [Cyanomargarita calcarea GSE-NOS-MK-12-04C]
MIQASGVIICLGYILGLLFTAVPWGGLWILLLGVAGAVFLKKRRAIPQKPPQNKSKAAPERQTNPKPIVWLIAGVVGFLATFYFQFRTPQPSASDISKFLPTENTNSQQQLFIVRGEVISIPRVTRSQRGQLWLEATQLDEVKNDNGPSGVPKGVSGKLYVTVPLLKTTGIYPGKQLAITGSLYKPKPASNPGAFDFQKFLKQEGTFAGLSGRQVSIIDDNRKWGWWKFRERIVRSQVRSLGIPEGALLSSMVLGSKAVDLPYDMRDLFVQAGLAHVLAASGFQTSQILGVVLGLTKRSKRRTQIILGSLSLIGFLALTGFQPSVLRAVIMGFAALIGLGLKRKVKQLGSLLVAAMLILLFNPLWIWDLGFQLSFLATLGLIVTVPAVTKRLGWLPPAIASLIAVPLAATIWTLPLLLHIFSVITVYSLPLNILATPLISLISIAGMASAIVGLISPDAGSVVSGVLYHPTHWLIGLTEFFAKLPGNTFAVGNISTWQMLTIYALLISAWLLRWWQKRWWFALMVAFSLVFVPAWNRQNTLFQVTVLAADSEPVLVIQDRGTVTLINSGDEETGRFTIVPFLQQQGVNQIDWAIASNFQGNGDNGWLELLQRMPIKALYDYSATTDNALTSVAIQNKIQKLKGVYQTATIGQTVNTGSVAVQLINNELPALQMQIQGQTWLLVGNIKPKELRQLAEKGILPHPEVLWCANSQSLKDLVPTLQPKVAIASFGTVNTETLTALNQSNTKLFFTGRDGAIQWTPNGQFEEFIQSTENKTSAL